MEIVMKMSSLLLFLNDDIVLKLHTIHVAYNMICVVDLPSERKWLLFYFSLLSGSLIFACMHVANGAGSESKSLRRYKFTWRAGVAWEHPA